MEVGRERRNPAGNQTSHRCPVYPQSSRCQVLGADYAVVKECAGADKRIGTSHFDPFHDGYRGYGGACLPKDTQALIQLGKLLGARQELLERVEEINNRLISILPKKPKQ